MTLNPSIRSFAQLTYRALNTPVALSCAILMRYGEWDTLATKATDPLTYLDTPSGIERYRNDCQAVDLIRKLDQLPTSFDKREVAMRSFYKSEEQCLVTNERLKLLELLPSGRLEQAAWDILSRGRKWISRTIGPLPDLLRGRFGPGTTFELKGSRFSTQGDKLWTTPSTTGSAEPLFRLAWEGNAFERLRTRLGLPYSQTVRGNRFTTVPKDGKTDRGICIEPGGNLFCQLGVGDILKERLAYSGIYVHREVTLGPLESLRVSRTRPNGQELHRQLALRGSLDGSWATIDLSSASDTVAFDLVRLLLPPTWFDLLCALRSPHTLIGGRWHRLEKFSSMGNGFTFELETLIFCGLIHGVTGLMPGRDFWVYGDDIIVPADHSRNVLACLRFFGFTPNESKTFTTGLFRESCGGDYYAGVPTRSLFVKSVPENPVEWITLYNQVRARISRSGPILRYIEKQVDKRFRFYGPPCEGHQWLHTTDHGRWKTFTKDSIKWVRGVSFIPHRVPLERWGEDSILPLAVLGVHSRGFSPRGLGGELRLVKASVS